MLRKEISHTKKQNFYKRLKRREIKQIQLEEEVKTLKEKESEVNNAMLKVKKIQRETQRQYKKICDQANYLKGRVETMTNERQETNK